jgi:NAD(P)-dependent dehydrogenase (short-subunit alcohol dehydrogenase family)
MDEAALREFKQLTTDQPELVGWTLPGLDQRTVILTGAGSGIGAAAARALTSAGARVLGVDRDAAGLEATTESLDNDRMVTFVADLTEPAAPRQIVSAAIEAFGQFTTIVSLAGVSRWSFIPDVTREHFEFQIGVNVYAPFFLVQAALPQLRENGGQIVLCNSVTSAYLGSAGAIGYTTSKHAALGLMRVLAVELAPLGIRVNSISPGTTLSPINDSLFAVDGMAPMLAKKNPDGRIAEPHEHVGAIGYLISDLAKHVYGHDLAIDGGRMASS